MIDCNFAHKLKKRLKIFIFSKQMHPSFTTSSLFL